MVVVGFSDLRLYTPRFDGIDDETRRSTSLVGTPSLNNNSPLSLLSASATMPSLDLCASTRAGRPVLTTLGREREKGRREK